MKSFYDDNKIDEVLLPIGCDKSMLEAVGEKVNYYKGDINLGKGNSVNQTFDSNDYSLISQKNQIYADNLSGEFEVMSIPESNSFAISMAEYLQKFIGKYVCLDLWTGDGRRNEKCGILAKIGDNFLVIKKPQSNQMYAIDLSAVKYISIYCR